MAELELHGRAVESYQQSIATLYEERHKLDESIRAIREGELIEALQERQPGTGNGWLQPRAMVNASPALRYQVQLLASHDFQEAVKNYRDLQALSENLDTWAGSMEAYDDMLATRATRYERYRPAAAAALRSDILTRLEQRHGTLADRLAAIEASGDPAGLASAEESLQWQRLMDIRARLDALPDGHEVKSLRDKQRRLQGVLFWRLNTDYKVRLWQAKQKLRELEALIEQGRAGHDALASADSAVPVRFDGFGEQIAGHKQAIRELQKRTFATQVALGARLEQLAVTELGQLKQRIETYLVQARFALAQTFDNALNPVAGPDGGAR
jgi:hypothetical protein